jgi:hypothetical protein
LTDSGQLAALILGRIEASLCLRYPIGEFPDAIRYLDEGRAHGKLVIKVETSADWQSAAGGLTHPIVLTLRSRSQSRFRHGVGRRKYLLLLFKRSSFHSARLWAREVAACTAAGMPFRIGCAQLREVAENRSVK